MDILNVWELDMENNLQNWVTYIGNQSIPVFNDTIQSVMKLTTDEKSSCKQLAEIILQDASLTSRVIRVANSPFYNRWNTETSDLRRVILLLGYKRISEICLTLSILDTLTDKRACKIVYKVISKSFHAAVQARSIAEIYGLKNPDKIYLATLLNNIGEISFWSLTGKAGRLISDLLKDHYISSEQAQINILGTTFRKLSIGLATEWQFSDLLKRSLNTPESDDIEIKCINYGYKIAESIINKNADFDLTSEKIAKEARRSIYDVRDIINDNILLAHDTYNFYVS